MDYIIYAAQTLFLGNLEQSNSYFFAGFIWGLITLIIRPLKVNLGGSK